jgi:hypothetical protein
MQMIFMKFIGSPTTCIARSHHYKKHLLPQTSQFEETMIKLTMQMKCSEKKARNILITLDVCVVSHDGSHFIS